MPLLGFPPSLAPVATGHPLGLPETPRRPDPVRVAPSGGSANADLPNGGDTATGDGQRARAAPPSVLQIKINALLQEQATAEAKRQAEASDEDRRAREKSAERAAMRGPVEEPEATSQAELRHQPTAEETASHYRETQAQIAATVDPPAGGSPATATPPPPAPGQES